MPSSTILSDNGVSSGTSGIKTSGGNDGLLLLQTTTAGGTATTAVTIGTDQSVTFAQGANLPNTFGFKNRLINGAMSFWQRGTTLTGTGAASAQYIADRWGSGSLTSAYVVSRSTDVPTGNGFQYSLKLQRSAGQTSTAQANVIQAIESVNMLDLAGQSVTLSFWAKAGANFSAASTAMGVIVETGTVADQGVYNSQGAWTGAAYPVLTTQVLTTSWQKFTFTGTFGSTALEACVYFYMIGVGTAGADDSIYITGVQLEKGSTATSFDFRSYGTEFALCQRYYYVMANFYIEGYANAGSIRAVAVPINFPVQMRATPTRTVITAGSYNNIRGSSSAYAGLGLLGLNTTFASASIESTSAGYTQCSNQTESMSAEL